MPLLTARWLQNLEEVSQQLLQSPSGEGGTPLDPVKPAVLQQGVGLWLLLAATAALQLLEGAERWCGLEEPPQTDFAKLPPEPDCRLQFPESPPEEPSMPAAPFIPGYDDADVAALPEGEEGYLNWVFGELQRRLQPSGTLGDLVAALQLRWLRLQRVVPESSAAMDPLRCGLGSGLPPTSAAVVSGSSAWKAGPRNFRPAWWWDGGVPGALFPHNVGQMRWLPPGSSPNSSPYPWPRKVKTIRASAPFGALQDPDRAFVGRLLLSGGLPQRLQVWDGPQQGSTVILRPSLVLLQQFAGLLDGDGCYPLRSGDAVGIRVGLESKDYRLLQCYSHRLALGPVRVHGQRDEVYLELNRRARVAALLQLLEGYAQHPEKIRQFAATARRLGYSGDCPPQLQGRNSHYFAGFYDADGSGGIYLSGGRLKASFSLGQKALLLSPEAAAQLPEGSYWRSDAGELYGHNPLVPMLQRTFGGCLSFGRYTDSKGVLRVTSRWQAASLEDLRRFSDYLQRCPPLSAKGRWIRQLMPTYLRLKLLGADAELLQRFHAEVYSPSRPLANKDYQNFLRSRLVPEELSFNRQLERCNLARSQWLKARFAEIPDEGRIGPLREQWKKERQLLKER
jgi:hypothetical protein